MKFSEKKVIKLMQQEYQHRLNEACYKEIDIKGAEGNIIIKPGLKVRHKDSQYEYTVDDLVTDEKTGDILVRLKLPDESRFNDVSIKPQSQPFQKTNYFNNNKNILGELDKEIYYKNPEDELESEIESEDVIFVIDKDEFENDYEVK